MEWKWTKSEPYERSERIKNERIKKFVNQDERQTEDNIQLQQIETSAYTSALNHDENTWDILNQEFSKVNKREDLDNKIAVRELIQQRGFNPFLGETNYADDISNKFLKPVNTTQDKVKTS
jgi:hypothetical protein